MTLFGVEMKSNIDVLQWRKVNYPIDDKDDREQIIRNPFNTHPLSLTFESHCNLQLRSLPPPYLER